MVDQITSIPTKGRDDWMELPKAEIPHALWKAGLAPQGITILEKESPSLAPDDHGPYFYWKHGPRWQPCTKFDDVRHLIAQFKMSIVWLERQNEWWVSAHGHSALYWNVNKLADVPYGICILALEQYGDAQQSS